MSLALADEWHLKDARAEVPHLPYVPEGWNGVLVLGEAQSLSVGTKTDGYVDRILSLRRHPATLAKRLWLNDGPWSPRVHVAPWHSGPVRLGLACRWPERDVAGYAVSNADPWAIVDDADRNENPREHAKLLARAFLARVVALYEVQAIVACGRVAQWVAAGLVPTVCIPSGSARALASLVHGFESDGKQSFVLPPTLPPEVLTLADGGALSPRVAAAYGAAAVAARTLP